MTMKVTRKQQTVPMKIKKEALACSKKRKVSKTPASKQGKMATRASSKKREDNKLAKSPERKARPQRNKTKKTNCVESKSALDDSIYDFDMSDEDGLKLVLFPEENGGNKVKKYTGIKRKRKASPEVEIENKAKIPKRALRSKDGNIKLMFEKLQERNTEKDLNDKKINANKINNEARTVKSKGQENVQHKKSKRKVSQEINIPLLEKVVLVTPVLRSQRSKRNKSNDEVTQATSTPSLAELDKTKAKAAPSEPQAHIMPSPMLSPVMKLSPIEFSPKKNTQLERVAEASSPNFKSPRPVDRTYSGRGSIGRFPVSPIILKENKKKSTSGKKLVKGERRSSSKYEDWALRMSLELEEAESYELSVD